jgi:hypothetical protein
MDDAQLRTVWQQRRRDYRPIPLSEPLHFFMKRRLARRVKQLSQLAIIWDEVIPDRIRSHTALETFSRGVLTVMVDTASVRFQLQTLLRGGLERAIRERFSGALNKIRLTPGQFYSVDLETGAARYEV